MTISGVLTAEKPLGMVRTSFGELNGLMAMACGSSDGTAWSGNLWV